jgi:hypothetical protein
MKKILAVLLLSACAPKPVVKSDPHPAVENEPVVDSGEQICGRIELSPTVAESFKPGTTLFVFAKPQLGAGPPTAVRRYSPDGFPFPFCLSQKNTMIEGLKFAGKVYVTARLDLDASGVIATPGDLEGVTQTAIEVGTKDLVLTIDAVKGK